MPALYTIGAIIGWVAAASLVACAIGVCFLCLGKRADDLSDKLANGDWPHVPEGLRLARKSGGGTSEQSGRADVRYTAHNGTGK